MTQKPVKKEILFKRFLILVFVCSFFFSTSPVLAQTTPVDRLKNAFQFFVTGNASTTSPVLSRIPPKLTIPSGPTAVVSKSAILSALRSVIASGLPADLKEALRGPQGVAGPQGLPGPQGPGSVASYVQPTNNQGGGLIGGYASLGVQNLETINFLITNNLVQTGGSTQLKHLTATGLKVTGTSQFDDAVTISANAAINSLNVSGQTTFSQAPTLAHAFSAWPTGTSNISNSSLYVNPASSVADGNLIGAAVNGTVKFLVDAEGDIYANNLILSGSTTTGATTIAGNLSVQDNITMGDSASDTITFNGVANSNLTFTKSDPSVIFNSPTATDTDFWFGVQEDGGGDDDDLFQIGDGSTPGTNPFFNLTTAGNLGIGTASPNISGFGGASKVITIYGADNVGDVGALELVGNKNGAFQTPGSVNFLNSQASQSSKHISRIQGGVGTTGDLDSGVLFFSTADNSGNMSTRMIIDESGNVGVGTTNPASKVNISGGDLQVESGMGRFKGWYNVGTGRALEVGVTGGIGYVINYDRTANSYGDLNLNSVVTVTSGGNVGIGTTGPGAKLHIQNSNEAIRMVAANDTSPTYLQFRTSASTGQGLLGTEGNTAGNLLTGTLAYGTILSSTASGTALQLGSAGSVKMTILSSGNVGIGSTAPGQKLVVSSGNILLDNVAGQGIRALRPSDSAAANILFVQNGNSGNLLADATIISSIGSQPIQLLPNSGAVSGVTINSSGSVGIGTTNPSQALTIQNGNIRFNSTGSQIDFSGGGTLTGSGTITIAPTSGNIVLSPTSGNVGIGSASPSEKLDVNGAMTVRGGATTAQASQGVFDFSGGNTRIISRGADGSTYGGVQFLLTPSTGSGALTPMVILPSGNVGIGSTNPGYKLDVNGTIKAVNTVVIASGGFPPGNPASSGVVSGLNLGFDPNLEKSWIQSIRNSSAEIRDLQIQPLGGNVGIGSTSPGHTLDVAGTGRFSGALYVTGFNGSSGTVNFANAIWNFTDRIQQSMTCGNCHPVILSNTATGNGVAGLRNDITLQSTGAGQTQYGEYLSVVNSGSSTNAVTRYGKYITLSDSGSLANTVTGLYVDASTANASDTQYSAVFQGGNVGIGTTTPGSPLTVSPSSASNNGAAVDVNTPTATVGTYNAYRTSGSITGILQMLVENSAVSTSAHSRITAQTDDPSAGDPYMMFRVSGANDWSVGLDNSDSDKFKISSASSLGTSDRVTIDTSGNVGIATATPSYPLHVYQAAATRLVAESNTSFALLRAIRASSAGQVTLGVDDGGNISSTASANDAVLDTKAGTNLLFSVGASEKMRIMAGGNVGIGTTNALAPLSVDAALASDGMLVRLNDSTSNSAFVIRSNTAISGIAAKNIELANLSGAADMALSPSSAARGAMVLKANGNVGIGTTGPSYLLDVSHDPGTGDYFQIRAQNRNTSGGAGIIIDRNNAARAAQIQFSSAGTADWYMGVIRNGGSGTTGWALSTGSDRSVTTPAIMVGSNNLIGINSNVTPTQTLDVTGTLRSTSSAFFATSSGSVGIGSTSPNTTLEVVATTNSSGITSLAPINANLFLNNSSGAAGARRNWLMTTNYDTNGDFAIRSSNAEAGNAYSSGSTKFLINSAGNVGIGTATANAKLHIKQTSANYDAIRMESSTTDSVMRLGIDDTTATLDVTYGTTGTYLPFMIRTSSTERFRITPGGNVGIGTTGPSAALHVRGLSSASDVALFESNALIDTRLAVFQRLSGAVQAAIRYEEDTTGIQFGTETAHELEFYTNGASNVRMAITSAGNVGIGTTGPNAPLHVIGRAIATNLVVGPYANLNDTTGVSNTLQFGNYTAGAFVTSSADAYIYKTSNVFSGLAAQTLIFQTRSDANSGGFAFVTGSTPSTKLYIQGSDGNVGIGTTTTNFTGIGIDHTVLTIGGNASTPMGLLELNATRTSNADLGRVVWGNQGVRRAEIYASRIDEDTSTKLSFSTSNAGSLGIKMTIAKDGNVGIGTTVPGAKLDVNGTAQFATQIAIGQNNGGGVGGSMMLNLGTTSWPAPGSTNQYGISGNNINFSSAATSEIAGISFGIGTPNSVFTTSDVTGLAVNGINKGASHTITRAWGISVNDLTSGSNNALLFLGGGSNLGTTFTGNWAIYNNTSKNIYLGTGNVGIGTTNPQAKLQINVAAGSNGIIIKNTTASGNQDWTIYPSGATNSDLIFYDGTARLVLENGGNVGIGTTDPGAKLDVRGTVTVGSMVSNTTGGTTSGIILANNEYLRGETSAGGNTTALIGYDSSNKISIGLQGNTTIFGSGNIGIGTTTPATRVHIDSTTTSTRLKLTNSSSGGFTTSDGVDLQAESTNAYLWNYENGSFYIGTNGAAVITALSSGNVGIGTTNPQAILHTKTSASDGLRLENTVNGNGVNIRFDAPDSGGTNRPGLITWNPVTGTNQSRFGIHNLTTELVSFRMDGSVGIGSTNPISGSKLDIVGKTRINNVLTLFSGTVGGAVFLGSSINDENVGIAKFGNEASPNTGYYTTFGGYTPSGAELILRGIDGVNLAVSRSSDIVAMRINASGYVGIGTTNPLYKLHSYLTTAGSPNIALIEQTDNTSGSSDSVLQLTVGGNSGGDPKTIFSVPGQINYSMGIDNSDGNLFKIAYNGDVGTNTALTINNTGNIGIGTTNPNTKVDIRDGSLSLSDADVANGITDLISTTTYARLGILSGTAGGALFDVTSDDADTSPLTVRAWFGSTDPTDTVAGIVLESQKRSGTSVSPLGSLETVLKVNNGNTNMFTVLGSGNVGIGTTSPSSIYGIGLTLAGTAPGLQWRESDGAANAKNWDIYADGAHLYGRVVNDAENASATWLDITRSGATISSLSLPNGNIGIGTTTITATVEIVGRQSSSGTRNVKITSNVGGGLTNTEASFLTELTGLGGSGWTAVYGKQGSGSYAAYFDGAGYLNAGAWTYGSDRRLKENISDISGGLEKILGLNPVKFDYITGEKNNLGFIAQEVQSIIPEAVIVINPSNGMLGLKTEFIIPYTVEAIQELDLKITGLEERIAALEANSGGGQSLTGMAADFFSQGLRSMSDGVAYITGIVTDKLTIGSPEYRTGMTIFDRATGEPRCISSENGILTNLPGECSATVPTPPQNTPSQQEEGSGEEQPQEEQSETPAPEENPPAENPEPTPEPQP